MIPPPPPPLLLVKQQDMQLLSLRASGPPTPRERACSEASNCRQNNTCSLDGNCLQSSVIYQATVTRKDNNTTETYIGLTENDFKTRYRNHTASFRHAKHRNSTELSKHIWTLKDNNISNTLFPGAFSHRTRPTTAQVKDVTSASKKNF